MKKLFSKSYLSAAKQIGFNPSEVSILPDKENPFSLTKTQRKLTLSHLSRLPDNQLRTMLKIPCPIPQRKNISQEGQQYIINAFKRLRKGANIDEKLVCSKCKLDCPKRDEEVKSQGKIQQLLLFFLYLWKKQEKSYSQLRWCAAFRTLESFKILMKDIDRLDSERLLYNILEDEMERKVKKKQKRKLQDLEAEWKDRVEKVFSERRFKL